MKSLWKAYCQTFKDIISNTSIFTTLILSVLFYSFFIRPHIRQNRQKPCRLLLSTKSKVL
jgi:hypothetical protein